VHVELTRANLKRKGPKALRTLLVACLMSVLWGPRPKLTPALAQAPSVPGNSSAQLVYVVAEFVGMGPDDESYEMTFYFGIKNQLSGERCAFWREPYEAIDNCKDLQDCEIVTIQEKRRGAKVEHHLYTKPLGRVRVHQEQEADFVACFESLEKCRDSDLEFLQRSLVGHDETVHGGRHEGQRSIPPE